MGGDTQQEVTLETGRPKSVKFHEPSKQEVDLVKSIPQGGLGVAWPARVQMRVRQDHCREPGLQGGGRGGGGGGGAACCTSGAKNKY